MTRSMTIEEAVKYVRQNGMTMDNGLPLMPDKDSVPEWVWADCQAVYRAFNNERPYMYADPKIPTIQRWG